MCFQSDVQAGSYFLELSRTWIRLRLESPRERVMIKSTKLHGNKKSRRSWRRRVRVQVVWWEQNDVIVPDGGQERRAQKSDPVNLSGFVNSWENGHWVGRWRARWGRQVKSGFGFIFGTFGFGRLDDGFGIEEPTEQGRAVDGFVWSHFSYFWILNFELICNHFIYIHVLICFLFFLSFNQHVIVIAGGAVQLDEGLELQRRPLSWQMSLF